MTQEEYIVNYNEVESIIDKTKILSLFEGVINNSDKKRMFVHAFLEHRQSTQNKKDKWIIIKYISALAFFKVLFIFDKKNEINAKNVIIDSPDTPYHTLKMVRLSLEDFCYYYFPCFKFKKIKNIINFNNRNNIKQSIAKYTFRDILNFGKYYFKNFSKIKNFLYEANNGNAFDQTELFLIRLLFYVNYLVKKIKFDSNTFIVKYDWTAEHLSLVLSRNDTTQLQTVYIDHGMFWGYSDFYVYPVADYQICVSEREKRIICKFGRINPNNVFYIGGPLQAFEDFNIGVRKNSGSTDNRVLVLLTDLEDDNYAKKQNSVLDYLLEKGVQLTLRFRPASREKDIVALARYLKNDKVAVSEGNTLMEDLLRHERVITFSIDSVPVIFRSKKKLFLVLPDDFEFERFLSKDLVISDNIYLLDDFINNVDDLPQSNNPEKYYIKNFGEYRLDNVLSNLKQVMYIINNR